MPDTPTPRIRWFADLGMADLDQVGGKNSSLGEMIGNLAAAGVRVPDGFATTADAYRRFLAGGLGDRIAAELVGLDTDDVRRLAEVGARIRAAVVAKPPGTETPSFDRLPIISPSEEFLPPTWARSDRRRSCSHRMLAVKARLRFGSGGRMRAESRYFS